jgi:hypothetical protein
MKKLVVFIDSGMVQDVLVNSKEPMDILVVDFDKQSLDQSAIRLLSGPFRDVSTLADCYKWDAQYDPNRVKEIFETQQEFK